MRNFLIAAIFFALPAAQAVAQTQGSECALLGVTSDEPIATLSSGEAALQGTYDRNFGADAVDHFNQAVQEPIEINGTMTTHANSYIVADFVHRNSDAHFQQSGLPEIHRSEFRNSAREIWEASAYVMARMRRGVAAPTTPFSIKCDGAGFRLERAGEPSVGLGRVRMLSAEEAHNSRFTFSETVCTDCVTAQERARIAALRGARTVALIGAEDRTHVYMFIADEREPYRFFEVYLVDRSDSSTSFAFAGENLTTSLARAP